MQRENGAESDRLCNSTDRQRELRAKAKNYLSLGLVDEVDESDDVPFSGMKPATQKSNFL